MCDTYKERARIASFLVVYFVVELSRNFDIKTQPKKVSLDPVVFFVCLVSQCKHRAGVYVISTEITEQLIIYVNEDA